MKKVDISFKVEVERNERDVTEQQLRADVERMLHVFGRSNNLCIENVVIETRYEVPELDSLCRGFGCSLRETCKRFVAWKHANGYIRYYDFCDDESRNGYVPLNE